MTEQPYFEALKPRFDCLLIRIVLVVLVHFDETGIPPLPPMLRPCPGPTGRCTPVLGRREEGLPRRVQDVRVAKIPECSKGQSLHSTKQDEETIICNGYKTKVYFPESKNSIDY